MKRFLTTPIYYVNSRPHLGHAYTTILADILARRCRQRGEPVVFLTGTDEHGEKIAQMAAKQGKTPRELVDEVSSEFRSTWERMNLSFDRFYRTTEANHVRAVQAALQQLKDKGEIEFREYEGRYCVGCERFLTETELTEKGLCPDHLTQPELRKEGNYFFLMSRYQQRLVEHFERSAPSIQPEHYRNEILSFLRKEPLTDLCISRPKSRLTWGIEIPFDSNFVTYVWVDALLNYLVAAGWPERLDRDLWAGATHLIAKDILKTHAIYWTAILMALDVPPPRGLQVSGYWLIGGTKMSKSLGNVIRPLELEAQYGAETLRFYLLREMTFGYDATFTLEGYVTSINAHLANGIGNLVSRTLTLCAKNFKGVPAGAELRAEDRALLDRRKQTLAEWNEGFDTLKYQNALKAWSELVTACDLYINEAKPWALAKDPAQAERLQVVLGTCMLAIRALGVLIQPVMPQASAKICQALSIPDASLDHVLGTDYGSLQPITEVPKLFPRVALPAEPTET